VLKKFYFFDLGFGDTYGDAYELGSTRPLTIGFADRLLVLDYADFEQLRVDYRPE